MGPAGIISGAMSGAGEGMMRAGTQLGSYASQSAIQAEAAEIGKLRDARLSELRKGEITFEDELRRAPGKRAEAKIKAAREGAVDDLSGTVRSRTPTEMADAEESAYRSEGLVHEAMQVRTIEQQRQRDVNADLARTRDDNRADVQLEELKRHNKSIESINAAAEGRLKKSADLENSIKDLTLANAKRVEALRVEFQNADPKRKEQITEEVQLLTGKDNDKYLPVPLKDEAGNITGYKVFDTKRGRWLDDAGGGAQPSPEDIAGLKQRAKDPKAIAFFESKFGQGAAAKFLGEQPAPAAAPRPAPKPPAAPAEPAPMNAQQRREAQMRDEYDREQGEKGKREARHRKEFDDNIERTRLRSDA